MVAGHELVGFGYVLHLDLATSGLAGAKAALVEEVATLELLDLLAEGLVAGEELLAGLVVFA